MTREQQDANRAAGLNGCHNRAPFADHLWVQSGSIERMHADEHGTWIERTQRMVRIPNVMSKDCRYSLDPMGPGQRDPKCTGCTWKQEAAC